MAIRWSDRGDGRPKKPIPHEMYLTAEAEALRAIAEQLDTLNEIMANAHPLPLKMACSNLDCRECGGAAGVR